MMLIYHDVVVTKVADQLAVDRALLVDHVTFKWVQLEEPVVLREGDRVELVEHDGKPFINPLPNVVIE